MTSNQRRNRRINVASDATFTQLIDGLDPSALSTSLTRVDVEPNTREPG
jgi:hypothetical protein